MPDLIGENNAPPTPEPAPDTNAGAAPHPDVADAVPAPATDVQSAGAADTAAVVGAEADVGAAKEAAQDHAPHDVEADLVAGRAAEAEANKGFGVPPDDFSGHVPPVVGTAENPEPAMLEQAAAVVTTTAEAFNPEVYLVSADTAGAPADGSDGAGAAVAGADTGLAYAAASGGAGNGFDPVGAAQFGLDGVGALDAGQPPVDPLIDFIIGQLQPIEALGFLRGSIIWIAGRIGTDGAQMGDPDRLNAFNLAFQYRLREFKIKADADRLAAQDKLDAHVRGADADAQLRGFASAEHMTRELQALYADVSERLREWHKATQPGGDITSAPDIDRLLYDAWRIVEGVPKGAE